MPNPDNSYCRKGFFALNAQAIGDRRNKSCSVYPSSKGLTHDSTAFTSSRLLDLLREHEEELHKRGLFIAYDTAYNINAYMIPPYDEDKMMMDVDAAMDAFSFVSVIMPNIHRMRIW